MSYTQASIMHKISEIRKNAKPFFSNVFSINENQILEIKTEAETIAFLCQDNDVKRGYFATTNLDELTALIQSWPEGTGVEYLTKKEFESLDVALQSGGFGRFAVYVKAENNKITDTIQSLSTEKYNYDICEQYISVVEPQDLELIMELLYEMFNPLTSHIETKDEMQQRINRGDLVIHKENGSIMTLLTFDAKLKKLYMEHMINRGNSEYMHMLYYYVLTQHVKRGTKSVDTWIRQDNVRALNFVKRYGLIPNGLKNVVYCKK